MLPQGDVIFAPATPNGGAVSILRLSGPGCLEIADSVVRLRRGTVSQAPGFSLRMGEVPGLDEVLVSIFRAPKSYTGEDMVEISCHASPFVLSELMRMLSEGGARAASPGEFTRRAFTSGKMDLAQAEAVADLIASRSAAAHRMAFSQLKGEFSTRLGSIRRQLLELSALLELELDFPDEDVEFADRERLASLAREALRGTSALSESFKLGNAFKNGIPVAIAGAPNCGKSTLLNALLGEDRAIVSDIPGTTRDTVEEIMVLGGIQYRFIDTAGLRNASESVERMGIERSLRQLGQASVVLSVLDGTCSLEELQEVVSMLKEHLSPDARVIWLRNKADAALAGGGSFGLDAPALAAALGIPRVLDISARKGLGLQRLKEEISTADAATLEAAGSLLVTNVRHYEALRAAAADLQQFIAGLSGGSTPPDLLAEDLRSATRNLGLITGEITPDDILGEVFGRFCIGK